MSTEVKSSSNKENLENNCSNKRRSGIKLGLVTVCDNYVNGGAQKNGGSTSKAEPMRLRLTPERLILQKEVPLSEDEEEEENASIEYQKWLESCITESEQLKCNNLPDVRRVKLARDNLGLGINVKGGCEHNLPILISSLVKNSPADRCGQLFIGDAIVKVNDVPLSPTETTHDEAIKVLKSSGTQVVLTVKHYKTVSPFLSKCWKKKLNWEMPSVNNNCSSNSSGSSSSTSTTSSSGSGGANTNSKKRIKKKEIKVKWIDVISVDLVRCYVTKYIHDTDKVRPNGFEIRWFSPPHETKKNHLNQCQPHSNHNSVESNNIHQSANSFQQRLFSSAIVTCSDYGIYREWRGEIDKYVNKVNCNFVGSSNEKLSSHEQILFMGWVCQGYPSRKEEPHRPCYRWTTKYMVIKGGELFLYNNPGHFLNQLPRGSEKEAIAEVEMVEARKDCGQTENEVQVYKAYQSVLRCLRSNELVDERQNCFILLSTNETNGLSLTSPTFGPTARNGYLSVETGQDLMRIKAAWNKATYYSVTQLGSKTFSVICEGRSGSLTLDWKIGFAFYDARDKCYKWSYRFSQLKCSSDDGKNKLCLHFHASNNVTRNMSNPIPYRDHQHLTTVTKELICSCLQNLLYCMHSFLSAKVSAVDPSFL